MIHVSSPEGRAYLKAARQAKKPTKYRNRKTTVDGQVFDSAKEARRYSELKLLLKAGRIVGLTVQPTFPLVVNGQVIGTLVADFSYTNVAGELVVEDVKGGPTLPLAKWKQRHFRAEYGLTVQEIR